MTTAVAGVATTLLVEWREYEGGPVATMASVTVAIQDLATNVAIVATTSTGVATVATGINSYVWTPLANLDAGDYLVTWTGVDPDLDTVVATEVVHLAAAPDGAYTTLAATRTQLGKITADDRDELIQAAILAASRMIDVECGLWPGAFLPDVVATTRVVELAGNVRSVSWSRAVVSAGPIASSIGLAVAGGDSFTGVYSPWVIGTTYSYGPPSAIGMGDPIEWIAVNSPSLAAIDSIQVTARWGYPATPSQIELACRMLAARLYRRKDSPQGVITSADWGAVRVSRTDPDIHALLFPFITPGFA